MGNGTFINNDILCREIPVRDVGWVIKAAFLPGVCFRGRRFRAPGLIRSVELIFLVFLILAPVLKPLRPQMVERLEQRREADKSVERGRPSGAALQVVWLRIDAQSEKVSRKLQAGPNNTHIGYDRRRILGAHECHPTSRPIGTSGSHGSFVVSH